MKLRIILYCILLCLGLNASSQEIFKHITLEDGLPSTEVFFIYQDSYNNMWFCTGQGVSKFDGKNFSNYTTIDGLSHNTVFKVFEAPNDKLWFTCYDGSVSIYDLNTNQLRAFEYNETLRNSLGNYNWIQCISFQEREVKMYSYANAQIYTFDPTASKDFFESSGRDLAEGIIDQYENGLIISKKVRNKYHHQNVFLRDDPDSAFSFHFVSKLDFLQDIRLNQVYVFPDITFICKIDGLEVWDGNTKTYELFDGVLITGIERDQEGNYWVGTTNNGVYLFRLDNIKTTNFTPFLRAGETFTSMNALDSLLVIGTNKGRFIDMHGKQIALHDRKALIHSITKYNNGLYGSYGHGFSNKHGKLKYSKTPSLWNSYLSIPLSDNEFFHTMAFRYVYIDKGGHRSIWPWKVNHAVKAEGDSIYFSTYNELFVAANKNFDDLLELSELLDLNHVEIRKLSYTSPFLLLSTSGRGLIIVKNNKIIKRLNSSNYLPSDIVHDALIDPVSQTIWCAGNRGLTILKYEQKADSMKVLATYKLNRSTGLSTNNILFLAKGDKQIFMASNEKLIRLPLGYFPETPQPPKVNIKRINVNGVQVDDVNDLKYDENNLEIFFSAFSVQMPQSNGQFRYRLLRNNDSMESWITTNERSVVFRNLKHGKYSFQLACRSENSGWGNPQVYNFEVHQFWIDRPLTQVVLVLLGILLIAGIARLRILQLRKGNEKELELKAMQLKVKQLELASLRGQINPHFVFNALKSIQNLVLTDSKWKANELLTSFSRLIRTSLEFSRLDHVLLKEKVEFLKTYLDVELMRTPDRFKYRIDLPDELQEVKIPGLMIQPICENAVKHAFTDNSGTIEILFKNEGEMVCIQVVDDGIGYINTQEKKMKIRSSVGLNIIKERIEIIKDQYPNAIFKIDPLNKEDQSGTIVTLCLPKV